jgi:hypothetical protein
MLNLSSSGSRGGAGHRRSRGAWRAAIAGAGVVAAALAFGGPANAATPQAAGAAAPAAAAQTSAAQTTRDYVIRFWPRWISFAQQTANRVAGGTNALIGPEIPMSPQFRTINAINDDTIYASTLGLDLTQGPVILTIPATTTIYSILPLNVFGDTFETNIPSQTPGAYALTLVGWRGTLPAGVTRVDVPYPVTLWFFRADKYSPTGQNMVAEATQFRAGLRMATLANYLADPNTGPPTIVPMFPLLTFSFKVAEDVTALATPQLFLRTTQRAVHDPSTQPMYPSDLRLSQQFDRVFAAAQGHPAQLRSIERAVRDAYRAIVARWMTHVGATHWIHFDNIAAWGTAYLDRAAVTEYLQYSNNAAAAGYWAAFADGAGRQLNGARHDYKLTFAANQIPDAKRFWSLTAYVPGTIELVPNPANKYLVARYTPGLVYNADGGVTIYMSPTKPRNAPAANWLPVPRGQFSVYLRAYGPEGNTAPGSGYTPPPVTVAR